MLATFTKLLKPTLTASTIDAIAKQVAEVSLAEVCTQISGKVEGMSISEARGYIRARAAKTVRQNAETVVTSLAAMDETSFQLVVRAATERIIPQALRRSAVGIPQLESYRMAA